MTIPRNALGWPTVPPSHFTYLELLHEAYQWYNSRHDHDTVGRSQWDLYVKELHNRGFMTAVQVEAAVLPDQVPGDEAMANHKKWSEQC